MLQKSALEDLPETINPKITIRMSKSQIKANSKNKNLRRLNKVKRKTRQMIQYKKIKKMTMNPRNNRMMINRNFPKCQKMQKIKKLPLTKEHLVEQPWPYNLHKNFL